MRLLAILLAALLLPALLSGPGAAQGAFVQVEARPTLAQAQARARAYAGQVGDVNGFALGGGWYGIALGPYDADRARAELARLRAAGTIPGDSFVSTGEGYRERFWPAGAEALGAAVPADPLAAAVGRALDRVEAGQGSAPAIPEETPREAQASEAGLDGADRMALQRALQWFGFYDAAIDGSFGRGTRASMAAWQTSTGDTPTGILTTRQRARLADDYAASQAELGLVPLIVPEAGLSLTAPMGLVAFDRIEAPFVHYAPLGDSGVRMSLISQSGDAGTLAGLYEILQTLEVVPARGDRERGPDGFRIEGIAPGRTTEVRARLEDGHIVGYLLSWPEAQDAVAARALPEMERTLAATGAPLPDDAGFRASEQSFDMVSGLEVRRPLRSASGFFVDAAGAVATAAATVAGCGRITLDRLHDAGVVAAADGLAVLRPAGRLAPVEVAVLAPAEGRLRSPVSVGGFPYGGVLGAATLTFGTLEDVRGLDGSPDVLRLALPARDGDVGGPVLDPAGRVAGMLLPDPEDGARALPDGVTFALKSAALAGALARAGVTPRTDPAAAPMAPEDLAARAAGMTVLVSCWE